MGGGVMQAEMRGEESTACVRRYRAGEDLGERHGGEMEIEMGAVVWFGGVTSGLVTRTRFQEVNSRFAKDSRAELHPDRIS